MMYATADHSGRPDLTGPDLRLLPPPQPIRAGEPTIGADAGITRLYDHQYVSVARLAFLLVGDRHLAGDLAHDAFAKVYERWSDLDDTSKAGAYLRTTVTNLAMSSHRRRATARRHAERTATPPDHHTAASAEAEAFGRSERGDVMAALQKLSPKQRSAVVLKYWLGCTESEIASTLGCSIGSARTHLHRGHTALAATLGDRNAR
jgi:RNA polymerase sigma-70 factor (sigma-E family)